MSNKKYDFKLLSTHRENGVTFKRHSTLSLTLEESQAAIFVNKLDRIYADAPTVDLKPAKDDAKAIVDAAKAKAKALTDAAEAKVKALTDAAEAKVKPLTQEAK
tara:strand:- start:284 stop:595 length:312 start_codon:yes stop_codon:yes gene_type:complete